MKKLLSILTVIAISSTLASYAAEATSLSSYLNKQASVVAKKEAEVNAKIEAQKKADAAKKAELQKKQAEQQKALEKAKKDAEARKAAHKDAIEQEKSFWQGLFGQK